MDGKYVPPILRFAEKSGMTTKDYQAACGHAQHRRYLQISPALNKKVKFGRISIEVVAQEFLLRSFPDLEVEAMFAATFLKNLICPFGDRRLDDLLMSLPFSTMINKLSGQFRTSLSIRVPFTHSLLTTQ